MQCLGVSLKPLSSSLLSTGYGGRPFILRCPLNIPGVDIILKLVRSEGFRRDSKAQLSDRELNKENSFTVTHCTAPLSPLNRISPAPHPHPARTTPAPHRHHTRTTPAPHPHPTRTTPTLHRPDAPHHIRIGKGEDYRRHTPPTSHAPPTAYDNQVLFSHVYGGHRVTLIL